MKRCSASPIIREMPIKTTMKYLFTFNRMTITKKQNKTKQSKVGHSYIAGGNANGVAALEKSLVIPQKLKHGVAMSQQFQVYTQERLKDLSIQ